LDATKIQGGKLSFIFQLFDLQECLISNIEDVQATTSHTLVFRGQTKRQLAGDQERISQVIVNLLENAIKYSSQSKEVIVEVRESDHEVTVSVQDFGIGIHKKDQPHIFDRFYRANGVEEKTYPGLGIGLFIAAEIIKTHGGEIYVTSAEGQGSIFSFSIPFAV